MRKNFLKELLAVLSFAVSFFMYLMIVVEVLSTAVLLENTDSYTVGDYIIPFAGSLAYVVGLFVLTTTLFLLPALRIYFESFKNSFVVSRKCFFSLSFVGLVLILVGFFYKD